MLLWTAQLAPWSVPMVWGCGRRDARGQCFSTSPVPHGAMARSRCWAREDALSCAPQSNQGPFAWVWVVAVRSGSLAGTLLRTVRLLRSHTVRSCTCGSVATPCHNRYTGGTLSCFDSAQHDSVPFACRQDVAREGQGTRDCVTLGKPALSH